MAAADEKPDPNPMKFFEPRPPEPPRTREEEVQKVVGRWREELDRISDPEQRARAEAAVRTHAENSFAAGEKFTADRARWDKILEGLGKKNPVRAVGQYVVDTLRERQPYKTSKVGRKDYEKTLAIVTDAQKISAAFKQRQHSQRPMEKDNDRER